MTAGSLRDPIPGSIVQRLITNAAREMGITLLRSTRSPVLFEARDFATGIFDARTAGFSGGSLYAGDAFALQRVCQEHLAYLRENTDEKEKEPVPAAGDFPLEK